ncbi:MAG: hypothetical protein L6R39_004529 [Caloplaca ligustica]|nr:MAG: hypothetical protein L6R39_004529 [Caloplaca ligustica]
MMKKDNLAKHASEKAVKGGKRLHDKVMGPPANSRKAPIQLRTGTDDLNGSTPQIPPADTSTPSMATFFSDSPDSPINWGSTNTFSNPPRDLGNSFADEHGPAALKQGPSTAAPDAQIAPWLSADPSTSNGRADSGTLYDERPRKPSQLNDVADPMFCSNDRRPSMASATTVSSQNSIPVSRVSTSRGNPNKRLGAFFGDDGLDSSRSSDTSILTTGRDHSTSSQSRKARHNSVQTNNTDGQGCSPASSRPRSPLPSSDVTPWLFQDFKNSMNDRHGKRRMVERLAKDKHAIKNDSPLTFCEVDQLLKKMPFPRGWILLLVRLRLSYVDRTFLDKSRETDTNESVSQEIQQYGDAPVRHAPAGPDRDRYAEDESPSSTNTHYHHRLHFHRHRHTRSKDEPPKPPSKDMPSNGYPSRPPTLRQESSASVRALKGSISSPMSSSSTLAVSGTTPASSPQGGTPHEMLPPQRSPAEGPHTKRSLLDKIRGHKGEKKPHESLTHLIGSKTSLHDSPLETTRNHKQDFSPQKRVREASVATFDSGSTAKASDYVDAESPVSKKEGGPRLLHSHGKFPRPTRRGLSHETLPGKDGDRARNGSVANESLFQLDTDLDNMEGILDPSVKPVSLPYGGIFTGEPISEEPQREPKDPYSAYDPGGWDAPDSWAVKRVGDENMARLREIDEAGDPPRLDDDGTPHCVRVFRIDSTFATLSTSVNTTVAEILKMLGKKSFLQDDLDNYQIIMRKHDLQRQLNPNERPIAIQKTLLEQAGYQASDHIEEIGREDNSYLCRFTFVPTKLSGYYSLEKEPGQGKGGKYSHVDLQGRSLVTIPITLYQKSPEIISLNLSRNLALDVPKDFIQGCTNLREIKYISNEAWKLPPSFCLATKLTVLDLSNNCLEQLEHAELDKLQNLVSIKLSNNKLKYLPPYFNSYNSLRSLNLSSNYLETFPDFLCELKSLVDLDVSFNAIRALPKIGQLTTLERLWATNNRLAGSFPEQFKELKNIREIDIRFNAITSLDIFTALPRLEQLMVGHNGITKFEGHFPKIRILHMDHNPTTRFLFNAPVPALTSLNIASANVAQLDDPIFERMPSLSKLNMDKNHFVSISPEIGKLRKLEYLSMAKNPLSSLPSTIGNLQELKYLDVRECNLKKLPSEMWLCCRLDTLNVSSNVLEDFPKAVAAFQQAQLDTQGSVSQGSPSTTCSTSNGPSYDELGKLEDFGHRRPSQASGGLLSVGSSPASGNRNGSIVSVYGPGGRKASVISRTPTDGSLTPVNRKDSSNVQSRLAATFAGSLRNLYLADNRLTDDVFDELILLPELRILNLSYNELYDIPQRSLRRWQFLNELYLSGNELTSLPSDDLGEVPSLKVLHINSNKFQVLPAELGKVQKLAILDVGSNSLKYNVSNWPYDWNWNWNRNLKYLNFSGNKRLEIKPASRSWGTNGTRDGNDLTNFTILQHLRVLGLMDVTLTIPSVPDETEDRRVRTTGSLAGSLTYGMADSLGKHEHLSTIDLVVPKFRGHESETLFGLFDGQSSSSGGSKLARYLHENFGFHFIDELAKLKPETETASDALRRTFLALNKDLATAASQSLEDKEHRPQLGHRGSIAGQTLSADDLSSGGVATVLFLDNMELFLAHVGDAQAMLVHSDGGCKMLTRKHSPGDEVERERIRRAGGYVSRHGKLNEVLDVSRAFGYIQMMPAVMAAPDIVHITLREQDEMIIVASRELWEYMTPDVAVDVARGERGDLMRAAQKLRDLAMAFGATGKIMVMVVGVSDLKKRERNRFRGQSLSMGPSQSVDDPIFSSKRGKRKDRPDDSTLQRLDPEVEAPTGEVAMVFTDIKSSTNLWETYPIAMRSAIKIHNDIMRRQLRVIGGYEVKTEGDAFMVSFPTATSALLWCFYVQGLLLEANWPSEILESVHCAEVLDSDQNVIYKGVSVRMGIHWGRPVCEPDPITRRMDYFGPMVNRAARISGAADGGQIYVSSDFIAEIHRVLETYAETDRSGSTGSDDMGEDALSAEIRKELRQLSTQGFEVKDLGSHKLKGLENPEYLYLMYPHALAGRLAAQQARTDAEAAAASVDPASKTRDSQLTMETQNVWDLWTVSLRLEMICSAMESPGSTGLKPPERSVLERMKNRGGEVTDRFLVAFVEHQVSRIETSISALYARNLIRPFRAGRNPLEDACPMGDIWQEISSRLAEFEAMKSHRGPSMKTEQ